VIDRAVQKNKSERVGERDPYRSRSLLLAVRLRIGIGRSKRRRRKELLFIRTAHLHPQARYAIRP
jgi:hypothetical protein